MRFSSVLILSSAAIGLCLSAQSHFEIRLKDPSSLVRVGMDPHPTDSTDISLAYTLLGAIDHNNLDSIAYVRDAWHQKSVCNTTKDKAYSSLAYILTRYLSQDTVRNFNSENEKLLTDDLYHYFSDNDFEHLKKYLTLKYELNNYRPRSVKEFIEQRTFYEDFLMFNDPNRNYWDFTHDVLEILPIKQGDIIADIGCGFGYNAIRLKDKVGERGIIYATDTEKNYIDYLGQFLSKHNISGIVPINSTANDISVTDTLDMVFMSSLYHIIYTWSREDERKAFLSSIKSRLKEGGYFVIVDNINRHGDELNNCHVNPLLVEVQLGYWGFKPYLTKELSDQRYVSVFVNDSTYTPKRVIANNDGPILSIDNQKSIVHIGSLDSYDITDKGIDAAQYVYDFLGNGDASLANIAIEKYNDIIPQENFGGEYSALQWLCEVMTAKPEIRDAMLSDRLTRSFYKTMTSDSCKISRYYLLHKYKLGNDSIRMLSDSILEMSGEVGRTHRSYLEDYILALNPKRYLWEKTDSLIARLGIQKGDTIADIGSGSGFFSDKFSKLVGSQGHVYALEIKDEHIKSLSDFINDEHINNISIIKGKEDELNLPQPVEKMFMCSLYHIMYGVISDRDRDAYLKSLVTQLKDGGELIIVDNGPVDDETLPYHGPYISKELIITQLGFYGFELIDYYQFIPQRYMLKFKLNK